MIIKGDLTGDGRINYQDLKVLQAYLLSKLVLTEEQKKAADINDDGKINISDLALLQRHLLGIQMITEVIE